MGELGDSRGSSTNTAGKVGGKRGNRSQPSINLAMTPTGSLQVGPCIAQAGPSGGYTPELCTPSF